MNQQTLEVFTRDVYLYTTGGRARDINRVVATQLTEEPTVVISHSLGTVVAYARAPICGDSAFRFFVRVGSLAFVPSAIAAATGSCPSTPVQRFDAQTLQPLSARCREFAPIDGEGNAGSQSADNRHGIAGYLEP